LYCKIALCQARYPLLGDDIFFFLCITAAFEINNRCLSPDEMRIPQIKLLARQQGLRNLHVPVSKGDVTYTCGKVGQSGFE
jgi:hypothetical protein